MFVPDLLVQLSEVDDEPRISLSGIRLRGSGHWRRHALSLEAVECLGVFPQEQIPHAELLGDLPVKAFEELPHR